MTGNHHLRRAKIDVATVTRPEIRKILPQIANVLASLRKEIRHGTYSIVIGEDTSGRIPALLIGNAINSYNRAHGMEPVPIVFIQGTKDERESYRQNRQLDKVRKMYPNLNRDKKALLVSDIVTNKGFTTEFLNRSIRNSLGMESDVAALAYNPGASFALVRGHPDTWRKSRKFCHGHRSKLPFKSIWHREDLTGIRREPKFSEYRRVARDSGTREKVREVRSDVRSVSEGLGRVIGT